jgi:hypothetical protein
VGVGGVRYALRRQLVPLEATERAAPSMNSQDVDSTVQAMAKLDMPLVGSLRDCLWAAAERVAASMSSQVAVNMVWALAVLDKPSAGSLRDVLLGMFLEPS